ncbi:MAG: V-type ATP synthase subunit I [Natronomonas sp.]
MSRVSVTGSRQVMDDVIETLHDLRRLHVTDYDGSWEGFEPGNPMEGAEELSEKLLTVRSLESKLGITEEDAGRPRIIEDDELESELEEIRTEVNDLDDRRAELRDEIRTIDERIDAARPFAELGIDLDLLSGYDSIAVVVGEGDPEAIESALADAETDIEAYETFSEGGYVAIAAYPAVDIEDNLVGTAFNRYEVPDLGDGDESTSPEEYIADLETNREAAVSKLETIENELEDLKHEVAGFLLAAEEQLTIEVQKREAPLTFATTENAFVAEGWVPTAAYDDLVAALDSAVGDHADCEELERAEYDDGHVHNREPVEEPSTREEAVATDGGHADRAMSGGAPPVIQKNSEAAKPFELLVGVINRPRYDELDPTLVLFLTFPAFFGFMIGDVGYGILYCLMGFVLMSRFESPGFRSLGGVAIWAGIFTIIFGVLYGEFFGLHELGYMVFGEGGSPMDKGLSPENIAFAQLWLIVSLLLGLVHLTVGHVFGFIDDLSHGVVEATAENLSWVMLMLGAWAWIFSTHTIEQKPAFLVGPESVIPGFTGLPAAVGLAGLAIAVVGLVLLLYGEGGIGLLESLNVFVNILSYTRIAAVLLAKAGMAFVVNLLVFGAYQDPDGGFHFIFNEMGGLAAAQERAATEGGEIMFAGILTDASGAGLILAILAGALIFVLGHILVLLLGITSAGLQGIRLEYVEFFNKFYEGGGKPYEPFGYERRYTTED